VDPEWVLKEASMGRLVKATRTYWRDSAIAGAVGGAAMLLYEALAEHWLGAGLWLPVDVLINPLPSGTVAVPGYLGVATWVGIALHLLAAAAWGLGYGAFLALVSTYGPPRMVRSWTVAALMGLGWGVVAYLIMGLLIGPAINPKAFLLNPATFFVAHLVFGLVTGLTLTSLSRRPAVAVIFAPEEARVRTPSER
jgi:hypothetical protein